jgi:hypothetical protein
VQLAPTERCESDCPFCSVAGRPLKSVMPFEQIVKCLRDFRHLGARACEITGGGNPLLYRDAGKTINDIIDVAYSLNYDIGIISNSHNPTRFLQPDRYHKLTWLRISLIQLDEGIAPEDYDFGTFPMHKLAFSYIIYDATHGMPDELSRTRRVYQGTTLASIQRIVKLVELHPEIKFVRLAGNCLTKGSNQTVYEQYMPVLREIDTHHKFFIKEIHHDDGPFDAGCYIGGIRPYIAPHPHGGDYQVYICTSHVLHQRVYDLRYSLGSVEDILPIWGRLAARFRTLGYAYEVEENRGKNWQRTCKFCYYKNNNHLLHTVVTPLPDKNFV